MRISVFYKLGKFIYPLRFVILILWLIGILACLPILPKITAPFKTTGFIDETSPSALTLDYINERLGFDYNNKILILYTSKSLKTTNKEFFDQIHKSLQEVEDFSIKTYIFYPDDNPRQIAKNKRSAYAVVVFKKQEPLTDTELDNFKQTIKKQPNLTMHLGGDPVFVESVNKQTQIDLFHADLIAMPLALITLVFVFGSVVAASLPILLGAGSALLILTGLYLIGHVVSLSIFTLNIALLLGLCLTLDYSLFIVSRFRDEISQTDNIKLAIARTEATAGKAIFFSGLAVLASLSALLFFPVNILYSMAIGGIIAVIIAVLTAIILLPALLSLLKNKVNFLSIHILKNFKINFNIWHNIATTVVKYPVVFFVSLLVLLLAMGFPFLYAKLGVADYKIFPKASESRQFFEIYADRFDKKELSPILLVAKTDAPVLEKKNLSRLYDLTDELKDNPLVNEINSIVNIYKDLPKERYYALYQMQKKLMEPSLKALLATTTGKYFTIINITSKYEEGTPENKKLIEQLENLKDKKGMETAVTGRPVNNVEVLASVERILPWAILWIMVSTYILLLILLRSLILPIKAIFMTLLSLCACYGAVVLIFQEGYLHQFFNFEPQGMLDISLLVIIFCALFGFSMDYEVFLLTRIKEYYEKSHNNKKSIIFGIEKSSRIITSAALIVIFICMSFLVADILMVKAIGLGIAVAIFVDAFLIRTFFVPATMTLLGEWNWYLPKWLDKILPKL